MSLLYLIEKHYRIRTAAHLLGQLSTLFVTHISRRSADKPRHSELLHILAHIDAYQRIGRIKQVFRKLLRQMRLAYTCRSEKHEGTYRLVRIFQTYAVALYSLHYLAYSFILTDDGILESRPHLFQTLPFGLRNALSRHTGHHRHHLGHLVLINRLAVLLKILFPFQTRLIESYLELLLRIAVLRRTLKIMLTGRHQLVVGRFGYRILEGSDLIGHCYIGDMHPRSGFVKRIDGLVGECPVGDIPLCQTHACLQRLLRIADIMVHLILVLDVMQYRQSFLWRCRLHHHLLEAAFESAVLLDILAILVQSRRTDALYLATRQRRLEQIGRIHRTGRITGSHDSVKLIDKQYHIAVFSQLVEYSLNTLLKLTAILRAGHKRSHVERYHPLAEQHTRHLALHYPKSQPLDYRTLTHTGLTYQHRIVLFATAQYLRQTLYLHLTANHRIQTILLGGTCHVVAEFVEHRSIATLTFRLLGRRALILTTLLRSIGCVILIILVTSGICALRTGRLAGELTVDGIIRHTGLNKCIHEIHRLRFGVMEYGQQQMLHVDRIVFQHTRFEHTELYQTVGYVAHRHTGRRPFGAMVLESRFKEIFIEMLLQLIGRATA